MKLIYLRRLTTLLAFLDAVFKPAGIIHPEPPRNDDRHTKSPVLVSVYDIDLCEPLKKCPDTDEKRYWRKLCFSSSCQADEVYHCGVDEDLGTIVEFCYPRFPCDKGFYGSPKTEADMVQMHCKICPEGRFNPESRLSPTNMDQCSAHRHIPPGKNTVLFSQGTNSDPAIYYCDAKAGFASRHQTLFCKPSYQRCDCEFLGDACPGEDLLPDKRCVPKCDGERPPHQNFSCVPRKDSEIETEKTIDELKRTPKGIIESGPGLTNKTATCNTGLPELQNSGNSKSTRHTGSINAERKLTNLLDDRVVNDGLSKGQIIGISFGTVGFFVFVLLVYKCIKKGWYCCKMETNRTTAGHDYIAVEAREVNITVHASESSNSANSMSGNVVSL